MGATGRDRKQAAGSMRLSVSGITCIVALAKPKRQAWSDSTGATGPACQQLLLVAQPTLTMRSRFASHSP